MSPDQLKRAIRLRAKRICAIICFALLLLIILLAVSFRETILSRAGRFMAPQGDYVADVAILEGTEFIDRSTVARGMDLLASGKVKRLFVVLHNIAALHRPFGLNKDYPKLVGEELRALGLKEKDFKVIVTHIHQPITLTAATGVLGTLSQEHVKTAILISPGFHARRSYLIYQYVCIPFNIKIFPSACFNAYPLDHWWSQEQGVRDFSLELMKLIYYLAGRHIPLKLSYAGY
jgi:hypothetical protein